MADKLHWETVVPLLQEALHKVMHEPVFDQFRLVGGTALSLYLGHRFSEDIDLFTDVNYNSIDFIAIESYLKNKFEFVGHIAQGPIGMGKSFLIGPNSDQTIKLDLYYTEPFIKPVLSIEGIRLAALDDIAAMKIEVIRQIGRKKDFWDIHELLDTYSIIDMIALHEKRYPYAHDKNTIINNFSSFDKADEEINPKCYRGKHWEVIRFEILEQLEQSGLTQSIKISNKLLIKKTPFKRRHKGLM